MTESRQNVRTQNPAASTPERGVTAPYKYRLLSGNELANQPALLDEIKTMLLAQTEPRLHARYPNGFKFHQQVEVLKPERREMRRKRHESAYTGLLDRVVGDLTSPNTAHVLVVYDVDGKIAALADAGYDINDKSKLEIGIIRAEGSKSSENQPNITEFALDTIYQASLNTPNVSEVVAYVHANNSRSFAAIYAAVERLENKGYPARMAAGIDDQLDSRGKQTRLGKWTRFVIDVN